MDNELLLLIAVFIACITVCAVYSPRLYHFVFSKRSDSEPVLAIIIAVVTAVVVNVALITGHLILERLTS